MELKVIAIWQGIEFIEPIDAISEMKKKALEMIDLYLK